MSQIPTAARCAFVDPPVMVGCASAPLAAARCPIPGCCLEGMAIEIPAGVGCGGTALDDVTIELCAENAEPAFGWVQALVTVARAGNGQATMWAEGNWLHPHALFNRAGGGGCGDLVTFRRYIPILASRPAPPRWAVRLDVRRTGAPFPAQIVVERCLRLGADMEDGPIAEAVGRPLWVSAATVCGGVTREGDLDGETWNAVPIAAVPVGYTGARVRLGGTLGRSNSTIYAGWTAVTPTGAVLIESPNINPLLSHPDGPYSCNRWPVDLTVELPRRSGVGWPSVRQVVWIRWGTRAACDFRIVSVELY